jgi:hypothetical protein
MKSVNLFPMMAIAALVLMASCDKNGPGTTVVDDTKKTVTIKIANMATETRAPGSSLSAATTLVADAEDLTAMFFDTAGAVVTSQSLDPDTATETTGDEDAPFWEYNEGNYTFHLLPAAVNEIVITNLTEAEAEAYWDEATLPQPDNYQGDAQSAPVWGKSSAKANWTQTGAEEHPDGSTSYMTYEAGDIEVNALFARLEIHNIVCSDLAADARFSALGLAGIGILYGTTEGDFNTIYNSAAAWQKDIFATYPVAADVYAYNVDPADGVPNIAVKVVEEGSADGKYPGLVAGIEWPYYVRTKELQSESVKLAALEAGNVYQINYEFTCDNVNPWDLGDLICVDITVTPQEWVINPPVTPVFN